MKTCLATLLLLSLFISTKAQVGIGTTTPDPSSALDISSTSKGVLFPNLTSVQRTAIANPANGLMVFDTDSSALFICINHIWSKIQTSSLSSASNFSSLEYPDGLTSITPIVKDLSSNQTYTVPAGSNLYIQGSAFGLEINSDTFELTTRHQLIAKTGDVIRGIDAPSINGFLVPATVTPVTINLSTGNYIVPVNKTLVILDAESTFSTPLLIANGINISGDQSSEWDSPPLVFAAGTVFMQTLGFINGYLK